MKKIMLLLVSCILFAPLVAEQQNRKEEIKEEIKQKKIAFIKEKVNFTPEEERAFWPLYNDNEQKKQIIKQKKQTGRKEMKKGTQTPDYESLNDNQVQAELEEAQLLSTYYQSLKKILPAQKIYLFMQAERDFKKELMKEVRDMRGKGHD